MDAMRRTDLKADRYISTAGLAVLVIVLAAAIAVLLPGTPAHAQSLDELTYITEDYPPYNFEKDGKRQGIAVDLLTEVLSASGAAKSRADIKVWPWARGYETALREKNTVLFSTTRTPAREHLFKWVGPIMPSRIVLVAKKSAGIRIRRIEDLHHAPYRIGVVREDIGEQILLKSGVSRERTVQANSGLSVAKMLHAGRVDIWAYGADVILWNMKELGYPTAEYEEVLTLSESQHYYYALNKETDDRLVARLQSELEQLRAKGKFDEILDRYR